MDRLLLICGPTASGKTELAHKLALTCRGEIINADAMQLYKQFPIITASPAEELKKEVKYHLYNFLDTRPDLNQESFQEQSLDFSAARYVSLAGDVINDITKRGFLPIIVGGSGLYIKMLLYGYNNIPTISYAIRTQARNIYKQLGIDKFFKELEKLDPLVRNLGNRDQQRLLRAYEVLLQTGRSIFSFHDENKVSPLGKINPEILFLLPERQFLYSCCNSRLKKIWHSGAVEEVKAMLEYIQNQYPSKQNPAPVFKALAVSEITSYLQNKLMEQEAIILAGNKTRQYAKRQITWFKNQIRGKKIVEFSNHTEYTKISDELVKYYSKIYR